MSQQHVNVLVARRQAWMGMASGRIRHILDRGQCVWRSVDESLDGKAILQHWYGYLVAHNVDMSTDIRIFSM